MAVSKLTTNVSMKIKLLTGSDSNGTPIYSTRNFSGINNDATLENFLDSAEALASLMKYPLDEVRRVESVALGKDDDEDEEAAA